MNGKTEQLIREIIQLLQQVRQETEESYSYLRRNDLPTTIRNMDASRDEVVTIMRKWDELVGEMRRLNH